MNHAPKRLTSHSAHRQSTMRVRAHYRGQTPIGLLMGMVIMVVVLLVGIMIMISLKGTTDKVETDAVCATQIIAHSIALRTGSAADLPIICPSSKVTIKGSDENTVNDRLAKEMKHCWAMWGKGQMPLFGEREAVFCHICTIVTVDGVSQVRGLPAYLENNKATLNETYVEYLTGAHAGERFKDKTFQEIAPANMDASQPIAVIFYYAKGYTMSERLLKNPAMFGAASGFIIGNIFSAAVPIPMFSVLTAAGGATVATTMAPSSESVLSFIAVRPLTTEQISALGCQYAPAKNE